MAKHHQRKRLWIDPPFQSRLLLRIGISLALYALLIGHIGFYFSVLNRVLSTGLHTDTLTAYQDYFRQQWPLLFAFVLFTPALLYDLLRFSHRLAGPLYRCRVLMAEMARGKAVPEFKPRKKDLVHELELAFNALIREWNSRLEASTAAKDGEKELAVVGTEAEDPVSSEAH
jgi:hypothetical protein